MGRNLKAYSHGVPALFFSGKVTGDTWREDLLGDPLIMLPQIDCPEDLYLPDLGINFGGPYRLVGSHDERFGSAQLHGLVGKQAMISRSAASLCEKQIRRSDAVFAYISDMSCHATLSECGAARILGKPLALVIGSGLAWDELRYLRALATWVFPSISKPTRNILLEGLHIMLPKWRLPL